GRSSWGTERRRFRPENCELRIADGKLRHGPATYHPQFPSADPVANGQITEHAEDENTYHEADDGRGRLLVLVVEGLHLGGGERQGSCAACGMAVRSGCFVIHRVDLPFGL